MEIASDDNFTAYLLLRVDSIICKFLGAVRKASSIQSVPFHSLNEFDILLNELANERFLKPKIPTWISKFSNSENTDKGDEDEDESEKEGKKKKNPKKDKNKRMDNANIPECIKITNDEYDKVLKHNKHSGKKPSHCVKFWARGKCFANCRLADTHKNLPESAKKEMLEFLQKNGLKKGVSI